jgi:hypothetical protein
MPGEARMAAGKADRLRFAPMSGSLQWLPAAGVTGASCGGAVPGEARIAAGKSGQVKVRTHVRLAAVATGHGVTGILRWRGAWRGAHRGWKKRTG